MLLAFGHRRSVAFCCIKLWLQVADVLITGVDIVWDGTGNR